MTLFVTPLKQFLSTVIKESRSWFTTPASGENEKALMQELSAGFDRGRDISFGAVTLSQEGINLDHSIIPWSALRSFRLTKHDLILVRQLGNCFDSHRVAIKQVQHLSILFHLIETHSQVKLRALTH